MEKNDEVYDILANLGLDEDEITSVKKRNKFLDSTTDEDINYVIDFFKIKCSLDDEDVALMVISNPLILSESPERFNILAKIYDNIGFSGKEYREYLKRYDRAFSLNPKFVSESIVRLMNSGKDIKEIKSEILRNPSAFWMG